MPTIPKHTAGARGPDIYIAMDRAQNELSQTAPAGSSAPSGPGSTAGGAPPVFAAMSAKKGAEATLYAATEEGALDHPYCGPTGIIEMRGETGKARINRKARDEATASRLWDVSEELTGVRFLS